MSKLLGKGDIGNLDDLPIEKVEVPEWGGHVFVRTVTAKERDVYLSSLWTFDKSGNRKPAMVNTSGRLAALTICDERSCRIFDDDDADELGRKSPKALERVLKVARRLNGLDDESLEETKGN